MKCPHCLENFHDQWAQMAVCGDKDGNWRLHHTTCPACGRMTARFMLHALNGAIIRQVQVHPKGIARAPLPSEVVDPYASDYREACNVLADSPKASAALGRRCLQGLLRDKANVKKGNLYDEIEEATSSKTLPSDLTEALHHVRVIGNFAAHPEKSVNTGAIVGVEPGEAEWTLDVLESLFDFYFVRPAKLAERKAALDKKLAEAGKPPMK